MNFSFDDMKEFLQNVFDRTNHIPTTESTSMCIGTDFLPDVYSFHTNRHND